MPPPVASRLDAASVQGGVRHDGDLPTRPDDPAWEKAPPTAFPMIPNIVKEPRLYFSLNDTVTARVLFNRTDVAVRVDVDDRTYSVPGDERERQYRLEDTEPTADAVAVQFPVTIPQTGEKPWFRHGDRKHPVNMWYWRAPSVEPKSDAVTAVLDAAGPEAKPVPRRAGNVVADGTWKDGQWRVVMRRALKTDAVVDLQFEIGRHIPVAFANWDGVTAERGARHAFSSWFWLLLEPPSKPGLLYGAPAAAGLIAALLFAGAARRQRRKFDA